MEAMNRVKIYSVYEKYQAEIILGILRNNQIPCYRQGVGAGGYMDIYAGNSLFGEDIYVDKRDAQEALELIRQTVGARDDETVEYSSDSGRFSKIFRILAWIWIIQLIIAVLFSFISSVLP